MQPANGCDVSDGFVVIDKLPTGRASETFDGKPNMYLLTPFSGTLKLILWLLFQLQVDSLPKSKFKNIHWIYIEVP